MAEEGKVEVSKERTDYRSVPSCCGSASSSDDEDGEGFGDLKNWAGRAKSGTEANEDSEAEFNQILELCRLKREAAKERAEAGAKAPTCTDDKKPQRGGGATRRVFDDEYYSLPPAEDPAIHVQEDIELKRFGVVHRLIDFIVNIKPDSGVPHLGYDTMLFDGERNAVGPIFEVFGPVCDTMYALRFNSAEEASLRLPVGMAVFYAPEGEGVLTKVILTDELKRMKISDPAGKAYQGDDAGSVAGSNGSDGDDEPAFSDDEQERLYHERLRMRKVQRMRNDQRQRDPSISSSTGRRAVPPKRPRGAHTTAMARGMAGFQRFSRPPPPRSSYPRNQAPHFAVGAPPMGMPPAPLSEVAFVKYSRPPPPFHHQVLYQAPPPPPPPPRQWTTTRNDAAPTTMGMVRPGYHFSSAHRGSVGRGGVGRGQQ